MMGLRRAFLNEKAFTIQTKKKDHGLNMFMQYLYKEILLRIKLLVGGCHT